MSTLIQAGPRTYYIDAPVKIGIWLAGETDAYLIDAGNDKDAGRRVLRLLEQNNWRLRGILNTHSNADHIGGNRYLQRQTGCSVFATDAEAALIRRPLLEPSLIYGGYPYKALRNKFLMAEPSDALPLSDPAFPSALESIPLPGHFIDMVGFRTPDNVVFLADSLCSEETLAKYGVAFLYDVGAQLETLDRIEAMEAALFVPAHAPAGTDMRALAQLNRETLLAIADTLCSLCEAPTAFDDLLARVFARYSLTMNASQHVLVGSTIRSYLSWLVDTGRLTVSFTGNIMRWQRV